MLAASCFGYPMHYGAFWRVFAPIGQALSGSSWRVKVTIVMIPGLHQRIHIQSYYFSGPAAGRALCGSVCSVNVYLWVKRVGVYGKSKENMKRRTSETTSLRVH